MLHLSDEERNDLSTYIDPYTFWKASTGRLSHVEITTLATYQPPLL